jgi:glycosyltransferase involved in cell wall biosynthesis
MAYLINDNLILISIPRTASKSVEKTLLNSNLKLKKFEYNYIDKNLHIHVPLNDCLNHFGNKESVCITRNWFDRWYSALNYIWDKIENETPFELICKWEEINNDFVFKLFDDDFLYNLHLGNYEGYMKCLNRIILGALLKKINKILSIGTRNKEFYLGYRNKKELSDVLIHFPLPHRNKPFESLEYNKQIIFTFLVFGRLEIVKGVDRIIQAYSLLEPNLQQRSRLLIAGEGSIRGVLEEQVNKLGLKNRVEFRGPIPSDEAHLIFGESNALVIASHDEPWGLVVNEALSSSIPVIGPFWIGSFADLVVHEETGLVTVDNSPEQLTEAMEKLLSSPTHSRALGKAGRDLVRDREWTIEGSLQSFAKLPALRECHR